MELSCQWGWMTRQTAGRHRHDERRGSESTRRDEMLHLAERMTPNRLVSVFSVALCSLCSKRPREGTLHGIVVWYWDLGSNTENTEPQRTQSTCCFALS